MSNRINSRLPFLPIVCLWGSHSPLQSMDSVPQTVPTFFFPLGAQTDEVIEAFRATSSEKEYFRIVPEWITDATPDDSLRRIEDAVRDFLSKLVGNSRRQVAPRFDVLIAAGQTSEIEGVAKLVRFLGMHSGWPVRVFLFLGVSELASPWKTEAESDSHGAPCGHLKEQIQCLQTAAETARVHWAGTLFVGGDTRFGLLPKQSLPHLFVRIFQMAMSTGLLDWLESSLEMPRCLEDLFEPNRLRVAAMSVSSVSYPSSWTDLAKSLCGLQLVKHYCSSDRSNPTTGIDVGSVLNPLRQEYGELLARRLAAVAMTRMNAAPGSLHERYCRFLRQMESGSTVPDEWRTRTIESRMRRVVEQFEKRLDGVGNDAVLAGRFSEFEASLAASARQLMFLRESCTRWLESLRQPIAAAEDEIDELIGAGYLSTTWFLDLFPFSYLRRRRRLNRLEKSVGSLVTWHAEREIAEATLDVITTFESSLNSARHDLDRFREQLHQAERSIRDAVAGLLLPPLQSDVAAVTVDDAFCDFCELAGPVRSEQPICSRAWRTLTATQIQEFLTTQAEALVAVNDRMPNELQTRSGRHTTIHPTGLNPHIPVLADRFFLFDETASLVLLDSSPVVEQKPLPLCATVST